MVQCFSVERWVCSSRKIAAGSLGIHNSRAKIIMDVVMVHGSRKVVMGYADTHSGCSVGHYGLEKETFFPFKERRFLYYIASFYGINIL